MTEQQVPEPVRRYESYTHEAMAAEVAAGNDPAAAGEIGEQWAGLGTRLRETMQALGAISGQSLESWQGPAGDAVRATLGKAASWSEQATEVSLALSDAVNQQAGIAARARAEMPPPVPYDPVSMIRQAAQGSLLDRIGLSDAMAARREESEAARAKAIDVMNARDGALRAAVPSRSFEAPPELA
ncbi:PE-PGRS family protein [Amycolatopsis acidicola]|uniref:PE-PGRS family protein n=1 Tax=Amycolatopsis acidicola TaxID=2596893 RepID=A0A5N0UX17_9PSEU|nr:PE-PGRS family protein [Amycolatopsis acidicola]KAA9153773.1 PE-PGRS family protein [Amycolatopsis acidicola]